MVNKMKKNKINTNTYYEHGCPKCKSDNYFEIRTGSDGLFTSSDFSHYKCEDCQNEFKSKATIFAVDREHVEELVQAGINRELSTIEMIKEFRKIGIYLRKRKVPKNEDE